MATEEALRQLYLTMLICRAVASRLQLSDKDKRPRAVESTTGREAVLAALLTSLQPADRLAVSRGTFRMLAAVERVLTSVILGPAASFPVKRKSSKPPVAAITYARDTVHCATGAALACKLDKAGNVAAAISESATSLDGWHEAFRYAGSHKLPAIYVCESGTETGSLIAGHAHVFEGVGFIAREYGFPGIIVDGTDAVAVWRVAQEAIHHARRGASATLIECRFETTAAVHEPLGRLQHYMQKRGIWDDAWLQKITMQVEAEIGQRLAAL